MAARACTALGRPGLNVISMPASCTAGVAAGGGAGAGGGVGTALTTAAPRAGCAWRRDRRGRPARPPRGRARRRRGWPCTPWPDPRSPRREYSMISRPIPPRVPVEISATIAPTTAAAAASLSAGIEVRHRGGQAHRPQRLPVAGGVGVHELLRRRGRRLQPPQRADGDREEGEVRGDDRDRHPRLPLVAEDLQLAAPADDERGQRHQGHGLGQDHVRAAGCARPGGSAASGWRGPGRR